ncbi:MAG: M14 family zinc carboxypeptidase [Bacteroidia bacterium]|nr:M14 family zinc carboxypeptidase [Bacteroidia bacterium]
MASKFFSVLFLAFFAFRVHAQSQNIKYHRIMITGYEAGELQRKLASMGMEADHGHWSRGKAILELSDEELNLLKAEGIPYAVLIEDVSAFYEKRAADDLKSMNAQKIKFHSNCQGFPTLKKPQWFHLGTMGGFYTLQQMIHIIDSMKLLYPNLITAKQPISSTLSIEGRPIYYVKISDNPNVDENETEILYTSIHHAREPMSMTQLIFFMWYILENYNTDPDIKYLVDNAELFFIPCLNPDGYEYNKTTNPNGGGMFRKNRRLNADNTYGVDLNRNYGYMWGIDNLGSSPTPSAQTYRGTGPFSEPETQAIRHFCLNRQFVHGLNAHSYSNLLIYPWGYQYSFYTPDSAWFNDQSDFMCVENRYTYGTADQTVMYIVNGSSDDWMYGEQTQKGKILAMTPESGSINDGFWPLPSNILDIAKANYFSNLRFGLSALRMARVEDQNDHFISTNGFIKYSIQRLGIQNPGTFTLSVVPLQGISSVGSPKVYTLGITQRKKDSISFVLSPGLQQGQEIRYILRCFNGSYNHDDTIRKIYGAPVTLLSDGFDTPVQNWVSQNFAVESNTFVSPPFCMADSPGGWYQNNQISVLTTSNNLNLTNANRAHLQFYLRYITEKTFDLFKVYVSTNNGQSWTALCGKYSTPPPHVFGSEPAHEGVQNEWLKEEIDLTPYIGNQIKIRFEFTADNYGFEDGVYLDNVLVRKTVNTTSLSDTQTEKLNILLYPSVGDGHIQALLPSDINMITANVYGADGKRLYDKIISNEIKETEIDLTAFPAGLYLIVFRDDKGNQASFRYLKTNQ